MLIEKEIIGPGTYWYTEEQTGLPRKLEVTPDLTKYWCEQGGKMLGAGLTVPVPYEHDFTAHPMTPKDKLLNNAGWVKEYKLKGDKLFGVVDIQDEKTAEKLPKTIRWTSPWINSFTDGNGKKWDNVISHLALTLRPRITKQQPFGSIAAALSMATKVEISFATDSSGHNHNEKGLFASSSGDTHHESVISTLKKIMKRPHPPSNADQAESVGKDEYFNSAELRKSFKSHKEAGKAIRKAYEDGVHKGAAMSIGFYLSKAGKLGVRKKDKKLAPRYPMAFSIFNGVVLGDDDIPPKNGKKPPPIDDDDEVVEDDAFEEEPGDDMGGDGGIVPDDGNPASDGNIDLEPYGSPSGDVGMEELLCDLLSALGIHCEKTGNEEMFKRSLYSAAMTKIHELTGKSQTPQTLGMPNQPPANAAQTNPLIQQEQQPMYMSLEEINKIVDPTMRTIALSMYTENQKLRAEMDANAKTTASLRDGKLKEAQLKRDSRIQLLSKVSPRAKADLEAMVAAPSAALSMGDGGEVIDPMAQTLAVLEKGLADLPRMLTTDHASLHAQPHPTDEAMLSMEKVDEYSNTLARMMGCPPEKKAS